MDRTALVHQALALVRRSYESLLQDISASLDYPRVARDALQHVVQHAQGHVKREFARLRVNASIPEYSEASLETALAKQTQLAAQHLAELTMWVDVQLEKVVSGSTLALILEHETETAGALVAPEEACLWTKKEIEGFFRTDGCERPSRVLGPTEAELSQICEILGLQPLGMAGESAGVAAGSRQCPRCKTCFESALRQRCHPCVATEVEGVTKEAPGAQSENVTNDSESVGVVTSSEPESESDSDSSFETPKEAATMRKGVGSGLRQWRMKIADRFDLSKLSSLMPTIRAIPT
eukprot:TRINITY_DN668_c0_g1_i3.p1 TRINITY_DN668_c0_g1~~TRINITY_DN668_c0_g1_i3.p1  ORF type:complete len:294 (-),score=40.09 TRINITY_DN668_c0_g1_i3:119-1000(-)